MTSLTEDGETVVALLLETLRTITFFLHQSRDKPEERRKMWGEPKCIQDVTEVFASFLEGKIKELPWIDSGVSAETNRIKEDLLKLNRAGFWTINSQPRVNGAPSTDPEVGWGGPGGLVFQKAYIEFFTSPDKIQHFLKVLRGFGNRFNYQVINLKGEYQSNLTNAMAVTWGIFPGKQVIQPTIIDPVSFQVWKDEAYQIWISKWASIYEEGISKQLIENIYSNYYLVNIVDNDFVNGNIYEVTNCLVGNLDNLVMAE